MWTLLTALFNPTWYLVAIAVAALGWVAFSQGWWLSPKFWLGLALVAILVASHVIAFRSGQTFIRTQWDEQTITQGRETLRASELNRAKEQVLQSNNQRIANELAKQKDARAAAELHSAELLRQLSEAADNSSTSPDSATACGADADPRLCIIAQCAGALVQLDNLVKKLASQTTGLQDYASSVCMSQAPSTPK